MGTLRVNVEAMVSSANHVIGQGEDLATEHLASSNKIESANAQWVGTSAPALMARAAQWTQTSSTLLARLSDHAQNR